MLGRRERSLDLGWKGGWTGQGRLPEVRMLLTGCVWAGWGETEMLSRTERTQITEPESYSVRVMPCWVPDTGSQLTLGSNVCDCET